MTATLEFSEPLLAAPKELILAKRIEAGVLAAELQPDDSISASEIEALVQLGKDAFRRVWLANLRLVNQISRQEARRLGVAADDVFQSACLGLAEAIMRYDHTRGARLATFAHPWITRAAREAATGVRPNGKLSQFGYANKALDELPAPDASTCPSWWVDELPPPEQRVVVMRHLGTRTRTLSETARALGLSQGQVRRLEASAFARVRHLLAHAA